MTTGIELRYRIVDVFSDRPLAGNGLCVVLDPAPESVMQALAREVNLSETTYPSVVDDDTYDVRIFTPNEELPFAGHPSLGTAWVLGPKAWTQRSAGATVTVTADAGGAVMSQPDPAFTDIDGDEVVAALGLPGAVDGYCVAEELRNDPLTSRACLVAVTGYADEDARSRSASAGFDHHLNKPVSLEAIDRVLDSITPD